MKDLNRENGLQRTNRKLTFEALLFLFDKIVNPFYTPLGLCDILKALLMLSKILV